MKVENQKENNFKVIIESASSSQDIVDSIIFAVEATTSGDVGTFIQHDFKVVKPPDPQDVCTAIYGEDGEYKSRCLEYFSGNPNALK